MAYVWCNGSDIQAWLARQTSIVISNDQTQYLQIDAERLENNAVRQIKRMLKPGWDNLPSGIADLIDLASKLAAAWIGKSNEAKAHNEVTPQWAIAYESEVYSELAYMIENHADVDIPLAIKKVLPSRKRIVAASRVRNYAGLGVAA